MYSIRTRGAWGGGGLTYTYLVYSTQQTAAASTYHAVSRIHCEE